MVAGRVQLRRQAVPWDTVVERFRGGTLIGDTLVGIGPDRRDALRHGRLVGIVSGADCAAGNGLLPLRPNHSKPLERAAGAARNVDHRAQQECAIGDLRTNRFMRSRPDHGLAAKPGVKSRSVVVLAVPPQQVRRRRALRLLFSLRRGYRPKRHKKRRRDERPGRDELTPRRSPG